MIGTRFIGLSISSQGLRTVALRKSRRKLQVVAWEERSWPGDCLKPGFSSLNVLEEETFCIEVRSALKALKAWRGPIALSLSDSTGIILTTTLNEPLKKGPEGINLLKWHLREQLPGNPEQLRLAYQVLGRDPGGKTRVLVAAARNEVMEQYEELLAKAGAAPVAVLFESLGLLNCYHGQKMLDNDHLLINLSSDTLALQLMGEGTLLAFRSRPAPADARVLYQEVSRTLASWEQNWPLCQTLPIYLHAVPAMYGWQETLESALGRPVQRPSTSLFSVAPHLQERPLPMADFCPVIGAAERLGRFCW